MATAARVTVSLERGGGGVPAFNVAELLRGSTAEGSEGTGGGTTTGQEEAKGKSAEEEDESSDMEDNRDEEALLAEARMADEQPVVRFPRRHTRACRPPAARADARQISATPLTPAAGGRARA